MDILIVNFKQYSIKLILEDNYISEGKKKELKSWAKSFEKKGIKCTVNFSHEEE